MLTQASNPEKRAQNVLKLSMQKCTTVLSSSLSLPTPPSPPFQLLATISSTLQHYHHCPNRKPTTTSIHTSIHNVPPHPRPIPRPLVRHQKPPLRNCILSNLCPICPLVPTQNNQQPQLHPLHRLQGETVVLGFVRSSPFVRDLFVCFSFCCG